MSITKKSTSPNEPKKVQSINISFTKQIIFCHQTVAKWSQSKIEKHDHKLSHIIKYYNKGHPQTTSLKKLLSTNITQQKKRHLLTSQIDFLYFDTLALLARP
jgi:hypothetical protein